MNFERQYFKDRLTTIVYHATGIQRCYEILRTDRFELTTNLGTSSDVLGEKFYYFSVSRIKFGGYVRSLGKTDVVIMVIDGGKFNQRYKGGPVDYWGQEFRKAATGEQRLRNDENEERVFTDDPYIPNATKYIKEIHILVGDEPDPEKALEVYWENSQCNTVKKINGIGKGKGIPVYVYVNFKAFTLLDTRRVLNLRKSVSYIDAVIKAYEVDSLEDIPDVYPYDRIRNEFGWINNIENYVPDRDLVTQLKNDIHNYRTNPEYKELIAKLTGAMRKVGVRTVEELLKVLAVKFFKEE